MNVIKILIFNFRSSIAKPSSCLDSSSHQQRETRGNSNGGLHHRQRDNNNSTQRPQAETTVAGLRPSSAPQQQHRRDGVDQWRRGRADQWQRRIGQPGSRGDGNQEENLFLNGWSSQFLSSQDISLHVVSQV